MPSKVRVYSIGTSTVPLGSAFLAVVLCKSAYKVTKLFIVLDFKSCKI